MLERQEFKRGKSIPTVIRQYKSITIFEQIHDTTYAPPSLHGKGLKGVNWNKSFSGVEEGGEVEEQGTSGTREQSEQGNKSE